MTSRRILFLALALFGIAAASSAQPVPDPGRFDGLSATVWFQRSGEYRALCYQAYTLARLRFDADLRDSADVPRRAVVVDIDETVLDNSPHQAKLLQTGERFPAWWKEWVASASAEAIPGAVAFLKYAASHGAEVFYITNRTRDEAEATMRNLQQQGFPQADADHVLPRERESGKKFRRQRVAASHRIVLLIGDNLNDLAAEYERASATDRKAMVDRQAADFGFRYIVLPNPLYGDWESAVFEYQRLTPDRQHEARLNSLRSLQ